MDPMELRRKNWIKHEEFPYETVSGLTYDSGNYEAATDKALELFGYDELRAEQAKRRDAGDRVQLGIGISTYTEMCGLAPSRVLGSLSYGAGGWESASIRVLPTGKVEVVTGTSPHGQSHVTSWSQITADALGVPYEDVMVLHGDTRIAAKGMDTYGSRSLAVGGIAVHRTAEKVIEKAKPFAAHLLEASVDDIEFTGGAFQVRGSPEARKTLQEVALAVFAAHDYPEGLEPDFSADTTFDPENFSFPHGTHLCATEVDTETGQVQIRSYVAVDDVGRVINPQIVDGQVHGGLAQGIAQALYEEGIYDGEGNLTTGTLVDYYASEGRFNIVGYAFLAARWNLFGWSSPGWQLARGAMMLLLIGLTYVLLRRLGASRLGATLGGSVYLIAPAAADRTEPATPASGRLIVPADNW